MRLLLSAFAFGPGIGSEAGGAWRWAIELSKQHEVVVVTDASRESRCRAALCEMNNSRLTVHFYRPWLLRAVPLNSYTAQVLFSLWQVGLLGFVRRLQKQEPFDLLHHLSYGVFRQASWLGFVGPPFVLGPLGGGEDAPWRLKASFPLREKGRERLRAAFNWIAVRNPLWRLAIRKASLVIARTEETRARLPLDIQAKTIVAQETGAPILEIVRVLPWRSGERIELLFCRSFAGP